MSNKKIAVIIGSIFLIINTATLSQYGITWDEPSNYLKANRFLQFFLTEDKKYLDLTKRLSVTPFDRWENALYTGPLLGHPPIGSLLPVITNKIFNEKLHLLNHVDGHHLALVILGSILIGTVFYFTAKSLNSLTTGFFAALLLATYPRFIAHAHFNPKDLPMTLFVFLAAMFFYQSAKTKSWQKLLLSSLFFGLAVGSKINAAFTAIPMVLWFLVFYGKELVQKKFPKSYFLAAFAFPLIAFFIFYATWPQIWEDAFENLKTVIRSAERVGLNGPNYWQTAPIKYLIRVSPTAFLVLVCLGGAVALYKIIKEDANRDFIVLVLLLIATPLIRVCMPKANPYDGIRQYLDVIPPLCILGGMGFLGLTKELNKILDKIVQRFKLLNFLPTHKILLPGLVFAVVVLEFALNTAKYHPYELAYFNPLFGGLKKAYTYKLPYSTDYWGGVYRQGVDLLNEKLPPNAVLDLPFGAHMIYDYNLRKDIKINITDLKGQPKIPPQEGDFIMYYTRQSSYSGVVAIEYCEANLKPVYTINVDGVPILKVFHNISKNKKH